MASLAAALATALGGCSVWQGGNVDPVVVNPDVHRGSESLAFDPSSARLASGGWDGKVALWRPDREVPERFWQAHDTYIYGIGFSERRLVTGGRDGLVRLWDNRARMLIERSTGSPISRMAVTAERVITGHTDGRVLIWGMPGLAPLAEHALHETEVAAVAAHEPSGMLASSDYDGKVYLYDRDGTPRLLPEASGLARSLTFDGAGRLFGGGWRKLYRWDGDGKVHSFPTDHWGIIVGLDHVAKSNTIASISRISDSSVFLLDPEDGSTVTHLRRHGICGGAVSASPDGRYIATTGDDGVVRIFHLEPLQAAAR